MKNIATLFLLLFCVNTSAATLLQTISKSPTQQDAFWARDVAISERYAAASSTSTSEVTVFIRNETNGNLYPLVTVSAYDSETGFDFNGSYFGESIAITNEWLAVGAARYDCGAVLMYKISDLETGVVQPQVLRDCESSNAQFGISVALRGSRLIVGAPYEHLSPTETTSAPGRVYMYSLDDNNWMLSKVLDGDKPGEQFGRAVAIDQSGFAATTIFETAVRVYDLLGNLVDTLETPYIRSNKLPGHKVSLSRNRIAVSAIKDGNNGKVFIKNRVSGEVQTISGNTYNGFFGSDLAFVNDSTLYIGASGEAGRRGRVYVYNANSLCDVLAESQVLSNPSTSQGNFGVNISASENSLMVAAYRNSVDGLTNSGQAILYTY